MTIDAGGAAPRVLVVDDDFLVREAFRAFFGRRTDIVLVGEATGGAEALESYERLRPDVVLMDLQMPGMSGIEATGRLCERWPEACVVALTTFGSPDHVVPALGAGASGYLLKDVGADGLVRGIGQALAGEMPLSPPVRRALVSHLAGDRVDDGTDPGLTERERDVLHWLAYGLGNAEIAARLYLSEGSVKQHLSHIGAKLGVTSRTQILVRAIQLGVVDPRHLPPVGS